MWHVTSHCNVDDTFSQYSFQITTEPIVSENVSYFESNAVECQLPCAKTIQTV